MKIERTKNAIRNILSGIILKVYQIIVPFLIRTSLIYFLGIEYLGLNSLFASILQVLNLAELGVGSAMVFSMYRPIAEDDTSKICALMRLYKIYYRIIGIIVCIIGMGLIPFIPKLIYGNIPQDMNIYVLYILNLAATVLTYWLFAYKNSILVAHQRNDINSKISLIIETIKYVIQFAVLYAFKSYYLFVITILFTQILSNVVTAIVANKMYPQYKASGKLPKNEIKIINRRIKDLFTAKLGSVIVNQVDTIVISAFLGLTMLAIYQNYYYLVAAVSGFISIIFGACTAGIGNSLVVETQDKNFNDFNKFTFIILWISGVCTACFLGLFQPFMELWIGKQGMMDFPAVVLMCIYFFIIELNSLLNLYKDAGGIWREDRFRPLVTAIVNLGINLMLVNICGIYGIILSTVLSMTCVGMPWILHNLFSTIFEKKHLKKYLKKLLWYIFISALACLISYFVSSIVNVSLLGNLIIRGVICFIIPNIIFFIIYHKSLEFKQSVMLLDQITKGKIKILKRL